MDPLISVVIPTRNRPELLLRAIDSVRSQSESCTEIVVIVDGPDEATEEALDAIEDTRLIKICLRQSVGGSEARNTGIRAARGRWIALLDDDDEWLPGKLAEQLRVAESFGDHSLVTCQYIVRQQDGSDVLRPRRLPYEGEPASEYMFDYLCYLQTSTFFAARNLFLQVPFSKTLASFQDIDWFLSAVTLEGVRLHVIPSPLAIYHAPDDRKTITSRLNWKDRLQWGRNNRHRMSPRAYSRFVSGSCVARAVQDKAGIRGLFLLLKECVLRGQSTPAQIAMICGIFLVTPQARKRIRDAFFLPKYGSRLA
jgi:glycosyltransferase involved in cell wall biosynthesis